MSEVKILGWYDEESKTLWEFKLKSVAPNAAPLVLKSEFDAAQSELAALREELGTMTAAAKALRDEWRVDQQRLTAAEQRNAVLVKAATEFMEYAESGWDHFPDVGVNLRAALKPTESGASE